MLMIDEGSSVDAYILTLLRRLTLSHERLLKKIEALEIEDDTPMDKRFFCWQMSETV